MNGTPFYNGAGLNISGAPMGNLQAHRVGAFAQQDLERANANGAAALGGIEEAVVKLTDYKKGAEARLKLNAIQEEAEAKRKLGLESAPGSAASFYFEDGTPDDRRIAEFEQEVRDKLAGVNPGFIDPAKNAEWEMEREQFAGNLAARAKGQSVAHQLSTIRRASEASLASAMEKGDYGEAAHELDRQVAAGILMPKEAQLRKLRMAKSAAGGVAAGRLSEGPAGGLAVNVETLAALQGDDPPEDGEVEGKDEPKRTFTMPSDPGVQLVGTGESVEDVAVVPREDAAGKPLTLQPVPSDAELMESLLQEGRKAGVNAYTLPQMFPVGVRQMSDDDVADMLDVSESVHGALRMERDAETGVVQPVGNSDTFEPMAAHAAMAQQHGGFTKEDYRAALWSAGLALLNDPQMVGLTEEHARKEWMKRVWVPGLEKELFDGDATALQAMLDETFANLWETRDAEIGKRVSALVAEGKDGLPGVNSMLGKEIDAKILARFVPDEQVKNLQAANQRIYNSFKSDKTVGQGFEILYNRYKYQFAADTGYELADDKGYEIYQARVQNKFKAWFLKKGGAYDTMRADYVKSARELIAQKATEAVARRRADTQEANWAEEQKLIARVAQETVQNLDGRDPWGTYRQGREEALRARAARYRDTYEKDVKPKLEAERSRRIDADAQERAAEMQEEQAREQRKKAVDAYSTRFTRAGDYALRFDRNATEEEPTLYVPSEDYGDIIAQLNVRKGGGIACSVDGKKYYMAVKPATQKGMSFNAAAFNQIYPASARRKMTKADLKKALRSDRHKVQFYPY